MSIFNKSTLAILVATASIGFSQVGSAAVTGYSQDFTGFDDTSNLGPAFNTGFPLFEDVPGEGFIVFGSVFDNASLPGDPATVGDFDYGYGVFDAPNGGPGFSAVAVGEGDGPYLNIYNDYNNLDHNVGKFIEASVFQERSIEASDIGSSWTFSGIFKSPTSGGIDDPNDTVTVPAGTFPMPPGYDTQAKAFIKTITGSPDFFLTNDLGFDTTGAGQTWEDFSVTIDLTDPGLIGQTLQFGFSSITGLFQSSGVYYDNLNFEESTVIPVPAAAWLFGSALLGLAGIGRRRRTA